MGLMDILNGMANGPRGEKDPAQPTKGMSKMTMALLALLAWKAYSSMTSGSPAPAGHNPVPPPTPRSPLPGPGNEMTNAAFPGGLGRTWRHAQGSAWRAAWRRRGWRHPVGRAQRPAQAVPEAAGHGDIAKSWISTEPNQDISPNDLSRALDPEQIRVMMEQSGLSREELLGELSQQLPEVVNQLTPDGRMPTLDELSRQLG